MSQRRIGAAERKMRSDSYNKFRVNRAHFMQDFPGFSRSDTQPRQQPAEYCSCTGCQRGRAGCFQWLWGKKRSPFLFGLLSNQRPSSHDEAEKEANSLGNGVFSFFFNGIWTVDWDMVRVSTCFQQRACSCQAKQSQTPAAGQDGRLNMTTRKAQTHQIAEWAAGTENWAGRGVALQTHRCTNRLLQTPNYGKYSKREVKGLAEEVDASRFYFCEMSLK